VGAGMIDKHTPGPWKIGRFESYEGDTGIAFRRVYFPAAEGQISEAHVRGENCDQNAHLIAAAPDLLAALEAMRDHPTIAAVCPSPLWAQMVNAILKARGETA